MKCAYSMESAGWKAAAYDLETGHHVCRDIMKSSMDSQWRVSMIAYEKWPDEPRVMLHFVDVDVAYPTKEAAWDRTWEMLIDAVSTLDPGLNIRLWKKTLQETGNA